MKMKRSGATLGGGLALGTKLNNKVYTMAAWFGIVLLVVALTVVALRGNWLSTLLLAAFLIASITFVLLEDRLPAIFNLLFVIAALLNAAGWVWGLYGRIPGYDEVAHFFTSFAVALALGYPVLRILTTAGVGGHRIFFFLVVASFGITLGALWEVFEWAALIREPDPVIDIIMDTLGAATASAAWFFGLLPNEPRESMSHGARRQNAGR